MTSIINASNTLNSSSFSNSANNSGVGNSLSINQGLTRQNRRHRRRHQRSGRSNSNRHTVNSHLQTFMSNSSSMQSDTSLLSLSLFNFKRNERNLLSASCAVFCIAVLAVSLVETRWFYLNGGGCNVNYVGVAHFFAPGRLEYQIEMSKVTKHEITVYSFILPNGLVLKNCANREIMLIMRIVIAFIFLSIFSSCIALMLDTFGCMRSGVKMIRRHGIFHILTVIFCLLINGFCFWISEKMYDQQNETRTKKGKKIDIAFDVSYYLIVLASGLSILATAFTLIRRYPSDEDEQLERLLEEYTGFEEPIHLERSLPANTTLFTAPNSNFYLLNSTLNSYGEGNTQRQPPPPPSTPPPSLHLNSISNETSLTEPPPPYDPLPAIA